MAKYYSTRLFALTQINASADNFKTIYENISNLQEIKVMFDMLIQYAHENNDKNLQMFQCLATIFRIDAYGLIECFSDESQLVGEFYEFKKMINKFYLKDSKNLDLLAEIYTFFPNACDKVVKDISMKEIMQEYNAFTKKYNIIYLQQKLKFMKLFDSYLEFKKDEQYIKSLQKEFDIENELQK